MDLETAYKHCTFKLTVIKEFNKVQVRKTSDFWVKILGTIWDEILNLNFE